MSFIQKFVADLGLQDSRFWRFWSEEGDNQVLMYGDILGLFGGYVLSHALDNAKDRGYKFEIIGDLYPLEEDCIIPEIQAKKIKIRARERKKEAKRAKNKGFKLSTFITIGKYKGCQKTIQWIIDNDSSYWNWLIANNVLLLHPEVNEYFLTHSH